VKARAANKGKSKMPVLRDIMRKQRMDYFIRYIGGNDRILEIGGD
jgi:hypothetical protein